MLTAPYNATTRIIRKRLVCKRDGVLSRVRCCHVAASAKRCTPRRATTACPTRRGFTISSSATSRTSPTRSPRASRPSSRGGCRAERRRRSGDCLVRPARVRPGWPSGRCSGGGSGSCNGGRGSGGADGCWRVCDRAGLLEVLVGVSHKDVQRRNMINTRVKLNTVGTARSHDEDSSSSSANFNLEVVSWR